MPSPLGGLFQAAQINIINFCQGIFTPVGVTFVDEAGQPLTVTMTADYPDDQVTNPLVHVGIEPGTVTLPSAYGRMGLDDSGNLQRLIITQGCKAVFTCYATSDPLRRYLADWLIWGFITGYATDTNGQRIDGYLITSLRQWGITPTLGRLFEPVQYPAPNLAEPRPRGLPFRAVVKLGFDLQTVYTTPAQNVASGTATVQPNNAPAALPITIPLPPTILSYTAES